jgi:hypothetical protein
VPGTTPPPPLLAVNFSRTGLRFLFSCWTVPDLETVKVLLWCCSGTRLVRGRLKFLFSCQAGLEEERPISIIYI